MNQSVNDKLKQTKNLAYYGRVSTKEQDIDSRQGDIVSNYLEKLGISFDKDFTDKISAYKKPYYKREGFTNLLKAIQKGQFDGIVVSDRDRISRQTDEHFSLRKLFQELNVPVFIASKGELYNDNDLIRNLIEDGMTKLESDNISIRTKAAIKTLIDQEKYTGGKVPFGYVKECEGGRVVGFKEDLFKLKQVRSIFRFYQAGHSFNDIARILNKQRRENDTEWRASKVKYILTNPIYAGYTAHNRIKGNKKKDLNPINEWKLTRCEFILKPLLSYEEWLYCWGKYQQSESKSPYDLQTSFYFQGLLSCHCGCQMKGKNQQTNVKKEGKTYGDRYYVCKCRGHGEPNKEEKCKQKVLAEKMDALFGSFFDQIVHPLDHIVEEIKGRFQATLTESTNQVNYLNKELNQQKEDFQMFKEQTRDLNEDDVNLQDLNKADPIKIGFLIAKNYAEQKIKQLEEEIKRLNHEIEGYSEILKDRKTISDAVSKFCQRKFSEINNSRQKRQLVTLMLKECKLLSPNVISFTFYSHPKQNYPIS